MSKKVISIVLSAAMIVAILCVGFGAVTASADTVTYYFLAPNDYLKTNDNVGVYYWQPSENAPWPGAAMTPAPEVGENVYKTEAPDMDDTGTIIFNAYVDAGNPADPALAAVAHQTININVEGYLPGESKIYDSLDNFYGMIYVLANDDEHRAVNDYSGAVTTSGEWFSINPSDDNYYKNYDAYYGTYDFSAAADTDSEAPVASDKTYHAGDTVKVSFLFGGVDPAGTLTAFVDFNKDVLTYVGKEKVTATTGTVLVNDGLSAEDGMESRLGIGCVFDPTGEEHAFAGDKVVMYTFTFTATKDFNLEDAGLSRITTEITKIENDDVADVLVNDTEDPSVVDNYTALAVEVICDHTVDTDTLTDNTTDSTTDTTTDTATDKTTDTATDKTSSKDDSSSTSSKNNSAASSNTSSKATNDNASKSSSSKGSTTSGSTTSNGAAVQTAGTFAVVSLVVILMAAAAVVLYTRKKTEE